ncbi:MAG: HAMP domain-containing sensor histidine kinase [Myxococcota bacterium]
MGGLLRLRSLRVRALLVTLSVCAAPLAGVWLSDLGDRTSGYRMRLRVERAAAEVAEDPSRAAAVALARDVRVRVVDAVGRVVADHDHEAARGIAGASSTFFFGPDGAPSLAAWDTRQPALADRLAGARLPDSGCAETDDRRLLVCHAAVATADGGVVYVQESSRRAIRALYDLRYQLSKLVLFMLPAGLLLGWWLGWRTVLPIERLQAQVRARRADASPAPVDAGRDDEIGDLARDLNALLGALEAKERANEAFAADLVHEVKNPVAAVRAVSEALEGPVDAERARRLAKVLRDASQRLDRLASRFLDLARAEAGLVGEEREDVDLAALARGLDRGEVVATGDCRVRCAPERIETVLRNLLDNAAHFAASRVVVRVTGEPDAVTVEVADDGPGIAPEDLPRVFDRFFTRRRQGGTGLGLALCKAIVEAHGGRIDARNDGGAVFRVRLPRG